MKKNRNCSGLISAVLVIGFGFVMTGCATIYYGQVDASVPMKEQCLLEIGGGITVTGFDGKTVKMKGSPHILKNADVASIPAGEHSLKVEYKVWNGRYLLGERWMVPKTDTVTYIFEAGNTYSIYTTNSDEVRISREKTGKPRSAVVVPENQGLGIGVAARSIGSGWAMVYPGQLGAFIDGDVITTGIYWDFGWGFGAPADPDGALGLFGSTGASAEFFLPGKSFGLGVGGGIASVDCFISSFSPYVRATVIPFKRITTLKAYFEYYLPLEVRYNDLIDLAKYDWGMGVNWFWSM